MRVFEVACHKTSNFRILGDAFHLIFFLRFILWSSLPVCVEFRVICFQRADIIYRSNMVQRDKRGSGLSSYLHSFRSFPNENKRTYGYLQCLRADPCSECSALPEIHPSRPWLHSKDRYLSPLIHY